MGTRGEYRVTGMHASKKFVAPTWSITLTVPVQVVSEANVRSHWSGKYKRGNEQASALMATIWPLVRPVIGRGLTITWTKLGGKALDTDNLSGAFKALRDRLAAWLGIDDGDERIDWEYRQEPGGDVGVRVEIRGKF